jgi:hypothetical protein
MHYRLTNHLHRLRHRGDNHRNLRLQQLDNQQKLHLAGMSMNQNL